jgi:hypothetical protein
LWSFVIYTSLKIITGIKSKTIKGTRYVVRKWGKKYNKTLITRDDVLKQRLASKGNRKRYSTALRKMTSTVLLKRGKNDGVAVYVPKGTILKDMAAKIE